MIKKVRQKLTMERAVTYRIKVPGELDERWSNSDGEMTVSIESNDNGPPFTILTYTLDQAALQGLLRRLYSLGIPLISVICVDFVDT